MAATPAQARCRVRSLHAKCAVADDHTALVTSANLTGAGLEHNMELGLLVRGGGVPPPRALWSSLAASGELVQA
ncbi:MAG: phospholipase D-like domain-containing protein [Acidimicrobiia bacterium]